MLFSQKKGFLVHKNDVLVESKSLHILKRANPGFSSKVPNIFQAHFSVQESLGLSFYHVVFSKGGFLVHKNDMLPESKNWHILKRVNP